MSQLKILLASNLFQRFESKHNKCGQWDAMATCQLIPHYLYSQYESMSYSIS